MAEQPTPHWHILGAGSIGLLWAVALDQSGYPATLLKRDVSGSSTATITLESGQEIQHCSLPCEELAQKGPVDHLLIATKAHQTRDAVNAMQHRISPQTILFLLQNGMGNSEWLREQFPDNRLVIGTTTDGAWRRSPYHVVLAGRGKTLFGGINGSCEDIPLPTTLLALEEASDITALLWEKVIVNSAINGLTAIHHCRNGQLLEIADARTMIEPLVSEAIDVANRAGIVFECSSMLERTHQVIIATRNNWSSMYQDIEHQRKTEIDFINGFILQQGARYNLPCPNHEQLVQEVHQLESRFNHS